MTGIAPASKSDQIMAVEWSWPASRPKIENFLLMKPNNFPKNQPVLLVVPDYLVDKDDGIELTGEKYPELEHEGMKKSYDMRGVLAS